MVPDAQLHQCRWGFYIEAFHLYEHIMLTSTAFFIGKPIGLGTLFGAVGLGSREFAVGTRVSWHFVMNLLPMPFAMMGIMEYWDQRKAEGRLDLGAAPRPA